MKRILSKISKYIEIDPSLFSKRVLANDDTPFLGVIILSDLSSQLITEVFV